MKQLRVTSVLFLFGGYLLIGTLYPFELSADFTQSIDESLSRFLASIQANSKTPFSKDFLVNILLFIPFGVLLYQLLESSERSKILTISLAAICGGCISFMIELCQVFISRHPQALDVLSNTVGTGSGALLAALWPRPVAFVAGVWERGGRSRIALCLVLLYGALPLILSIMQVVAPFHIWDSRFSFQVGNEATLNRPWLGKIYLVALYNRALSPYEISNNFYQGFASAGSERRAAEGLIALYTFGEMQGDIVHDTSGFREPLDLVISPQDRVRWLGSSQGIEILHPAIVRSQQTGTKLVTAVNATDEMSVEVWLTPDNTEQHGPARIVSISADLTKRNFTLGQDGANIQFRLRTPVSITNRSPLFLTTRDEVSTSDQSHVVTTYKNGVERSYLNGKEQPEVVLTRDGIVGFGTRKTAVAQLAYTFFYFFPVSFFLVLFFLARSGDPTNSLLLALVISMGLLIVTEFFQSFAFDRRIDVPLIAYGLIIAALGAVSGRVFATNNGGPNTSRKLSSVS
jgi:glycopeptide antibiotics resistance protein